MPHTFNHVHLKATDPKKTADWYVAAFGFQVVRDDVRPTGERVVRCKTADGTIVNISGARSTDPHGSGDAGLHYGLEHFGLNSDDVEADVKRLQGLGAELLHGPLDTPTGLKIAFIKGPDDVRIELLQPLAR